VCMGVLGCICKVGVVGCGRVWWGVGAPECAKMCQGAPGCARVCMGVL